MLFFKIAIVCFVFTLQPRLRLRLGYVLALQY